MILLLMGVSGSGKTTVGQILAERLSWRFVDADDYHPPANKEKMYCGIPLTDADREPWLENLSKAIREWKEKAANIVLACSALKDTYREKLGFGKNKPSDMPIVFLSGTESMIRQRLQNRREHFMNPNLLHSQFETLEIPGNAITVQIGGAPETIAEEIRSKLPN